MGANKERFLRSAAVREAGRAVVAWSFGLPLGAVCVIAEDASGKTQISSSDHLKLAEQIAVSCAGGIAQAVFEGPGHELATFKDNIEIMKLLEAHGYTEQSGALAVRAQGYEIAEAILEANRATVLALADQLAQRGWVEASDVLSYLNGQASVLQRSQSSRGCS